MTNDEWFEEIRRQVVLVQELRRLLSSNQAASGKVLAAISNALAEAEAQALSREMIDWRDPLET